MALAHLDGSGTAEAAAAMVARVQQLAVGYPEGRLELQLVGGFTDPHRYSDELFANIMCKFSLHEPTLIQKKKPSPILLNLN